MKDDNKDYKSVTSLKAWVEALNLVKQVYKVTKHFPKGELFGLTNQMRRAAVSVPSNIAEGYSRKSIKERLHFFDIAQASLSELKTQIYISKELGYLVPKDFSFLMDKANLSHKLLLGFITKVKKLSVT